MNWIQLRIWCLFSARISRIKHLRGGDATHQRRQKGVKSGGSNWENSPRDNNERFEWIAHESWQHIFHRHLSTFSRHFRIKLKVLSFLESRYKSKHRRCRLNTILVHFFKTFFAPNEKLTENIVKIFDFSQSFSAAVWHLAVSATFDIFLRAWETFNDVTKFENLMKSLKQERNFIATFDLSSLFMCDETRRWVVKNVLLDFHLVTLSLFFHFDKNVKQTNGRTENKLRKEKATKKVKRKIWKQNNKVRDDEQHENVCEEKWKTKQNKNTFQSL